MNKHYTCIQKDFIAFFLLCFLTVPASSQINGFTLVNASTNEDMRSLKEGDILNLATLEVNNLNIRANGTFTGSVEFSLKLNGSVIKNRTENMVPYSMFGDEEGNYYSWTPQEGNYSLTATPFSEDYGEGTAGTSQTIRFQIINESDVPDPTVPDPAEPVSLRGTFKKWQTLSIDLTGPWSSQSSTSPNPFLDYRLQVRFTHLSTGRTYDVPGYFDGNGAGGGSGTVWRVRFTPDEQGDWSYKVSFRKGLRVAIDLNPAAGIADYSLDGKQGSFTVGSPDLSAPGFLKKGRLVYSNGFYLRFQDKSYWIKGGTDSPENFLALSFSSHVEDWETGDPDWNGGEGKGIIGALNYLGNMKVNSIYFLPMNIGGDAQDTWPFAGAIQKSGSSANDNLHYDIGKLAKWETIFSHAQKKSIMLHFVLSEAEALNKLELDNATLGTERKLFYRELVARFSHHNALQWNLCEEYDYVLPISPSMIQSWAGYLQDVDPYKHPITVHNLANPDISWAPFVGDDRFSITSFQYYGSTAGKGREVEQWRGITAAAGRPIPISLDELRATTSSNISNQRKEILWPTYFSGGAGLEYFFGSEDQSLQDFRKYEPLWKWTWYARKFMEEQLPFWEMEPADHLLSMESATVNEGQVFAKHGSVYAVYLPDASKGAALNLGGVSGTFELKWYNPRTGNFEGTVKTVSARSNLSLGTPPSGESEDWVVLLTNTWNSTTVASSPSERVPEPENSGPRDLQVKVLANVSSEDFILSTQSGRSGPLQFRVVDISGRVLEKRTNLPANGTLQVGQNYRPGIYFIEVRQENQIKKLKVIKQR